MVFISERSKLIGVFLVILPTLLSIFFIYEYVFSIGFVLYLLLLILVYWIYFGTKYTIEETILTVKAGPFKWQVDIMSINSIKQTRTSIAAPAISLNRLQLYGNNIFVIVSPKKQSLFIKALVNINEDIDY